MRSSKRPVRGAASLAATFVLTLVGYLFLTAIPAMAAEASCDYTDLGGGDEIIELQLATDTKLALAVTAQDFTDDDGDPVDAGQYTIQEENDTWESLPDGCVVAESHNTDGGEDWIAVTGTNAGQEQFWVVQPTGGNQDDFPFTITANIAWENITVDLGSGSDTLGIEMGAYEFPFPIIGTLELPDPDVADHVRMATADGPDNLNGGVEQVVDFGGFFYVDEFLGNAAGDEVAAPGFGHGDMRIDNAEHVIVNTGDENDRISASDVNIEFDNGPDDTTTSDDIPDADGIFDGDTEPDEGDPNGDGACDAKPFEIGVTGNGGVEDDNFESGLANDTFNGGPGDDEVDYDGGSVNLPTIAFCDGPGAVTVDLDTAVAPPAPPAVGGSTGAYGTDVLNDIQDIEGTPHDDTLYGNDLSNDIRGNFGDDTIDGAGGDDNDEDEGDSIGIDDGLEGDNGTEDECPTGFSCDDVIFGSAGNDNVLGNDGDDELTGGSGDDEVEGEDGDDVVHEGPTASGADDLNGDDGSDVLDYSERTTATAIIANGNAASGQDANADGDAADSGDEHDVVQGDFEGYVTGSANDTIIGDGSGESFQGNAGDDVLDGSLISGFDDPSRWAFDLDHAVYTSDYGTCTAGIVATMASGTTAGTVTGGCGNDTLIQMEGVIGTDFDDVFNDDVDTDNDYSGLDGDDTFVQPQDPTGPNSDSDFIEGGEGTGDFLDLSARTGDIEGDMDGEGTCEGTFPVDCEYFNDGDFDDGDEDGAGDGEDDNWSETLEHITTGSGEDVITANDFNNNVDTGSGNDEAHGDGGNDVFAGGLGDDEVFGGDGNDLMETLEPVAAAPGDSLGDGADVFDGENGFDRYDARGRTASQNLTSDASCFQDDGLFGEGDGLCFVEGILGGAGNDFIAGDNANNTLNGFGGDDNIQGLKGRDRLFGGTGDDRMTGGKGPDALIGGKGFDTGNGNQGADTCQSVEAPTSCKPVQQA